MSERTRNLQWGTQSPDNPTISPFMPGTQNLLKTNIRGTLNTGGYNDPASFGMNQPGMGPQYQGIDWGGMNSPNTGPQLPKKLPGKVGGWMDGIDTAMGVAQVGIGVWNAINTQKNVKSMRKYRKDQMKMQKTDFQNMAEQTNDDLAYREMMRWGARGYKQGSPESVAGIKSYMDENAVKTTF